MIHRPQLGSAGHRPSKLGGVRDPKLWVPAVDYTADRLRLWGKEFDFRCGMCNGFELIAAGAVLKLRDKEGLNVRLIAVVPFEGHELTIENEFGAYTGKNPRDVTSEDIQNDPLWKLYWSLRRRADETIIVSKTPGTQGYMARNRKIVQSTDHLLVCWNGRMGGTGATMQMAKHSHRTFTNIYANICWELGVPA